MPEERRPSGADQPSMYATLIREDRELLERIERKIDQAIRELQGNVPQIMPVEDGEHGQGTT